MAVVLRVDGSNRKTAAVTLSLAALRDCIGTTIKL